jgi:protein pelota
LNLSLADSLLQTAFSPSASSSNGATSQDPKNSTATLQINGTVTNENDYVKLGAYHTLDLEGKLFLTRLRPHAHHLNYAANRDFRLYKASGWDSVSLERIEEATKEGRGADVGAVVLGEGESFASFKSPSSNTL